MNCQPEEENPEGPLRAIGYLDTSRIDALFIFDINDEGGNQFIGSGRLDGQGIPADFFSDIHVRRAFNYCFDWGRYNNENWGGDGIQSVGPIIPGMIGYNPDGPKYSFDLDECTKELELAWDGRIAENGFRMKLFDDGWSFASNLRDNLAEVDERYVIELVDRQELPANFNYSEEAKRSRLPIAMRGWKEDIHDPHNWVFPFLVGPDFAGIQRFPQQWAVEEFGPLINAGAQETDLEKRQAIYEKLTQLDYEKAIAIRLVVPIGLRYQQREVQGWYYNPAYADFYYYALEK